MNWKEHLKDKKLWAIVALFILYVLQSFGIDVPQELNDYFQKLFLEIFA
jgi:uncharacterized membrane protein